MTLPKPSASTTAVVTGASSGIGAAIARELAQRGHGVTLVARREDRLRDLAAELADQVRVEVVACDVADPAQRANLFNTIADRGLTVDILVNNAGIGTIGSAVESTVEAEIAQVRVNVEAVIDLTTRAAQQMVSRGQGAILNVGSVNGFYPFPGQSGYAGTKAFVRSYSQGIRAELANTGVTVAAVCPGPVRTEFLTSAGMADEEYSTMVPKILYRSARQVARTGVDALEFDRGVVIPGLPARLVTRVMQILPRRILLPLVVRQHPGLRNRSRQMA